MKKLFLLSIVFMAFCESLQATIQDSVALSLRKKAYERYHEVKDTVTVRTWMNMDRMNKALIEVVEYDNQLLESFKDKDSANMVANKSSIDTLLRKPVTEARTLESKFSFPIEYIFVAFVALIVLLMVLVILLVKQSMSLRKLRLNYNDREETFDPKLNRLEFLENEVVKMKTRENEVKVELEKGIVDYQDKMQTLRKRIEELANENTRLENLNISLSEGKTIEGVSRIGKNEEIKHEIIDELEGIPKRVKKAHK